MLITKRKSWTELEIRSPVNEASSNFTEGTDIETETERERERDIVTRS